MALTYIEAERLFSRRRKPNAYKRWTHNQVIQYNPTLDCYEHKHHSTVTVRIFREHFQIFTGGWDTTTTWSKIRDVAPSVKIWKHHNPNVVGNKFVWWGWERKQNGRGYYAKFTEFDEGIEVDYDGVPLHPQPYEVRVLRREVMKPFNAAARKVREFVLPRALIGEFDLGEYHRRSALDDEELTDLVMEVATYDFKDVTSDIVAPLFFPREQKVFGRVVRWSRGLMPDQPLASAETRLAANLTAARRGFINGRSSSEVYNHETRPAFER